MFESVFIKKMNQDEYDQKYLPNTLANTVCNDTEIVYSNLKLQMKNSINSNQSQGFTTIFNNLAVDSDKLTKSPINNINGKAIDKKTNNLDNSFINKDDLREYIPNVNGETANHLNHYSRINNDSKLHHDSSEQFVGNCTTSPKSVSSNCSNTTTTSASNSSPSNCNLNGENGSSILAYSPPTSNTSASSGKSFNTDNYNKIDSTRYDAMKNDTSNMSPNGSRSSSCERMKMNGNDRKMDREAQKLLKKELIPQRKRRDFIPEELKDDHYWERRRKNNLAAKRSREKRRINDIVLEAKVYELRTLNSVLKLKLDLVAKKFELSDQEIERIFEENKHLLEVIEAIDCSDGTNDSGRNDDTYVITETDTKENESQDEDSKTRIDKKIFKNKSSCSSNSSLNENSSGEEGTKRTKSKKTDMVKKRNKQSTKLTEVEKQNDNLMLTDIQYANADTQDCPRIVNNRMHKSSKSSFIPDNDVVKSHYPLLYGQLCREICNASDIGDNQQMTELQTNGTFASEKSESLYQLKTPAPSSCYSSSNTKARPQTNLLFNQLKANNDFTNQTPLNSIYEKNKETLNESLLMRASSQQESKFSLSKLLLSKKLQDEKALLLNQFSVNTDYKNFKDVNNKDIINSLVNEYFKNKNKQNYVPKVENSLRNAVDDDLMKSQMQKYKNLISRTNNINEEQKTKSLDVSSVQLHVNTLAFEKNINEMNIRTKKRHIQGEITNGFDKPMSIQQILNNQEIISPSSSSDKSYEDCQLGLRSQKSQDDSEDVNYNENINYKFSNHVPGVKLQPNVKIRKLSTKSPQNLNCLTNDENKNLLNCGSIDTGINPNATSISIQELINFSNGSQSQQQKLLLNGKYNNSNLGGINNNNAYATADNMPLKLRFKMLQLKTGEVN